MRALINDIAPIIIGGITLKPVTAERWRVVTDDGVIVGHVRQHGDALGSRFIAERWSPFAARFRELGSFWTLQDAAMCFRDGN